MARLNSLFRRKWRPRDTRMVLYLLVLAGVAAWRLLPRPWHPALTLERPHHVIYSTATPMQTEETANALELLYAAYTNRLAPAHGWPSPSGKLKLKLFKDRAEFRRVYPGLGWAEAFYREPFCLAYFSADEENPYHWMLHESVHQLNREVAGLKLSKWLEEGLATYFSTSRLTPEKLEVGQIDPNTYPVWWLGELAADADLEANVRNGSVIPLRCIITNRGGPALDTEFNLYYLHWWSLTHFLFESPHYRERAALLVRRGGDLKAFEELIGPVGRVQAEWHAYVRKLKVALAGAEAHAVAPGNGRSSSRPQTQ